MTSISTVETLAAKRFYPYLAQPAVIASLRVLPEYSPLCLIWAKALGTPAYISAQMLFHAVGHSFPFSYGRLDVVIQYYGYD